MSKAISLTFFVIKFSFFYITVVAGYETTSTALSYLSYILATHPEEQRELREHTDAHFDPETERTMPTYEAVNDMDCLDTFIRETLRMFPIVPAAINRQSTEKCSHQRLQYRPSRVH